MGKFSGLVSSAIFVGLFAMLVYFCCRVKRRGEVIQRSASANQFQNGGTTVIVQRTSHQQPHQPQMVPGGLVGYPSSYPAMGQQQVYAPTTGAAGYYPSSNASSSAANNPPYPVHASNMPMPQRYENTFQQAGPPYPTAGAMPSAPMSDMDDPPPSYMEAVSKQ